jgi:paraquat-inducible protein A
MENSNNDKTLGYSLTALILYIPANLFPFMKMEMYGVETNPTIWSGIVTLSKGDSWYLGVVVFIASMLVPFLKLIALFYLSLSKTTEQNKLMKKKILYLVDKIGPWSMLDIFLLAVLICVLKMDAMASVSVGKGAFMFLLVVIFTMLACSSFNKKTIEDVCNEKI